MAGIILKTCRALFPSCINKNLVLYLHDQSDATTFEQNKRIYIYIYIYVCIFHILYITIYYILLYIYYIHELIKPVAEIFLLKSCLYIYIYIYIHKYILCQGLDSMLKFLVTLAFHN